MNGLISLEKERSMGNILPPIVLAAPEPAFEHIRGSVCPRLLAPGGAVVLMTAWETERCGCSHRTGRSAGGIRLFGKEPTLLAWGQPSEERWWLFTMTHAATRHALHDRKGWRKAVRFALAENPVVKEAEGDGDTFRLASGRQTSNGHSA